MSASYTELGAVSYAVSGSDYSIYWTQDFAKPRMWKLAACECQVCRKVATLPSCNPTSALGKRRSMRRYRLPQRRIRSWN